MRELKQVEVNQVAGGLPVVVGGAIVGGVIGGAGYMGGTANPSWGGFLWGVGSGAVSGAFGAGAVLWGARALSLGTGRAAAYAGGWGLSSTFSSMGGGFGGGYFGGGYSCSTPRMNGGGGSW